MNATVEIRDVITDKLLQTMGTITYDNEGKAFQNCERWYSQELENWADKNYSPQIILVPVVDVAAALGKKGGSVTSKAKADAARRNGRKGGRPRKKD